MSTTLLGVAHAIMWNYNDCVGCVPLASQAMPLTFAQNVRFVLSLRQDWDRIATHGWGGCMPVYAWLCLFMHACLCIPVCPFLFAIVVHVYFVGCIPVYACLFMHSCLCIPVYAFLFAIVVHVIFC
jgi:hypothetical protein